jgi:hypothetical protein
MFRSGPIRDRKDEEAIELEHQPEQGPARQEKGWRHCFMCCCRYFLETKRTCCQKHAITSNEEGAIEAVCTY